MRQEERRVALALAGVAAVLLAFVPALMRALLYDHAYWMQIYIWVLFFGMCATAWNIIGGYAGQYSFGHAAFLGIGAYASTLLYLNLGLSPWIGMLIGGIVAALAGRSSAILVSGCAVPSSRSPLSHLPRCCGSGES